MLKINSYQEYLILDNFINKCSVFLFFLICFTRIYTDFETISFFSFKWSLEAKTLHRNIFKLFFFRVIFIYLWYYTGIPYLTSIAEILRRSAAPGLNIYFSLNVHSVDDIKNIHTNKRNNIKDNINFFFFQKYNAT